MVIGKFDSKLLQITVIRLICFPVIGVNDRRDSTCGGHENAVRTAGTQGSQGIDLGFFCPDQLAIGTRLSGKIQPCTIYVDGHDDATLLTRAPFTCGQTISVALADAAVPG